MIEAMACGTPVIAYRSGSVPEVIDDGVTGFIVESEEEAVDAVKPTRAIGQEESARALRRALLGAPDGARVREPLPAISGRDPHRTIDSDA